ncbi:MAG TPA: hypothetical protein VK146_02015 [Tabrizicola sp.]|nr:hypothetical protein [Tabrizicola sp.]
MYRLTLPLLLILAGCQAPVAEIRPQQAEGGPLQIGCRSDVPAGECMQSAKNICAVGGQEMTGYRPISSTPTGKYSHEFFCVAPGKGNK